MLPEPELRKFLARVPLISVGGPWTRVTAHHLLSGPPPGSARGAPPQPLWPGEPVLRGARFNPKDFFGGVYLASDPVTALEEVGAIFVFADRLSKGSSYLEVYDPNDRIRQGLP